VGPVIPVFDTNILIDYLLEIPSATEELARFPEARISVVTWIEVMTGARDEKEKAELRVFLSRFEVIYLEAHIAETAAMLRSAYRLKTPDAIIWATARIGNSVLITRNTRDFPDGEPDIRVPYDF
jgi:predicted nucleic acid-binding protein